MPICREKRLQVCQALLSADMLAITKVLGGFFLFGYRAQETGHLVWNSPFQRHLLQCLAINLCCRILGSVSGDW